jgi:MoaA/NifB/PqqE/SkfB family radical SAM enzyme
MNKTIKKALVPIRNIVRSPVYFYLRNHSEILKPQQLVFMTTEECNSRCVHCSIWKNKAKVPPLSPEEIERTLRDPLFRKVRGIINTGGEPMIRDDIEEVLLAQHKALPKAKLQLSTNGLLPKKVVKLAKSLLRKNIPISIGVSLDGIGKEHDVIRGIKGNFERVDWLLKELSGLKKQYKNKLEYVIGYTLSDLTADNLSALQKYGKKMKTEIFVQWYNQAPFYGNTKKNFMTSKKVAKIIESLPSSLDRDMWLSAINGKPLKFPCFSLYTFCVLNANGDILPCLNYFDKPVGNVRKNTPTQIWHSPEIKKVRQCVKKCPGCLNSWGTGWSFAFNVFPVWKFYIIHPKFLINKIKKE